MPSQLSKARVPDFSELFLVVSNGRIHASSFSVCGKRNPSKFQLREDDRSTCIESCIQDPYCLGYGHVSPLDCILIISSLDGDFTNQSVDLNEIDNSNEYEFKSDDYSL